MFGAENLLPCLDPSTSAPLDAPTYYPSQESEPIPPPNSNLNHAVYPILNICTPRESPLVIRVLTHHTCSTDPAVYPFVVPYPSLLDSPTRPSNPPRPPTSLQPRIKSIESIPLPPTPPPSKTPKRARSGTLSWRPKTPPKRMDTPSTPSDGFPSPMSAQEELHALMFGDLGIHAPATPPEDLSPAPSSGIDSPAGVGHAQLMGYNMFSPVVRMPIVLPSPASPVGPGVSNLGTPVKATVPAGRFMMRRRSTLSRETTAAVISGDATGSIPRSLVTSPKKDLEGLKEVEEVPIMLERKSSLGRLRTNDELFKRRQMMHGTVRGAYRRATLVLALC